MDKCVVVANAICCGADVPYWRSVAVKAGHTLVLGAIEGAGSRTYLAVSGMEAYSSYTPFQVVVCL